MLCMLAAITFGVPLIQKGSSCIGSCHRWPGCHFRFRYIVHSIQQHDRLFVGGQQLIAHLPNELLASFLSTDVLLRSEALNETDSRKPALHSHLCKGISYARSDAV